MASGNGEPARCRHRIQAASGTRCIADLAASLDSRAPGRRCRLDGITNLGEVVGGCTPLGSSGAVLEKEVAVGQWRRECSVQFRCEKIQISVTFIANSLGCLR